MRGSGGTEGGVGTFFIGLCLAILAAYLFFDSVRVTTGGQGWISGYFLGGGTASGAIVFVPFFLGVVALFYNAKWQWAWNLMYGGLAFLAIEILSRIRFWMYMKTTHLMLILVLFGAGVGLMIRSYKEK